MMFGTSARKLVRRDDPLTSHVAAALVKTSELEEMVYHTIKQFGRTGCISDQVLELHRSYPYSSITARFSGLIDKGLVKDTGERRKGRTGRYQRVMVAL